MTRGASGMKTDRVRQGAAAREQVARIVTEELGDGRAWREASISEREERFGAAYSAADRILGVLAS